MKKILKDNYVVASILLLGGTILFWLVALITRGETIINYYVPDQTDTYMDYFNMLANIPGLNPYQYYANYPAFPFVLWRILFRLIPVSIQSNSGKVLRNTMEAQLGFILFMLICIFVLLELIRSLVKAKSLSKILFQAAFLFSGPFIFTIERGNIILLAYVFTLVFIKCYDSPRRVIRFWGYFALCLAVAIKIYPALFGILVLYKKRYKEAIGLIIGGVLLFILPFFAFNGISDIIKMMNGFILSSQDSISSGFGYNYSFLNLIRILYGFFGSLKNSISPILYIVPVIICILIFIGCKEIWKKIWSIVLFIIWIPTFSYTYTLIFIFIPLILLLNTTLKKKDYVYLILMILTQIPYFLPGINFINNLSSNGFKFELTWGMAFINLCIIVMAILLSMEGIVGIIKRFTILNSNQSNNLISC